MEPVPANAEVEDLVERARAGDRDAEERLFTLLDARVRRVAERKLRDREAARDIAQETLRTIHEKYRSARFEYGFLPWVFTILHHKVGNHLKRERTSGGPAARGENAAESRLARLEAESHVALNDLVLELERALTKLPSECREVIRLLLAGASRGEIHAALGGGVAGTLDSRVSRCRRRLIQIMGVRP